MKIKIIGAGLVGASIANNLAKNHDVELWDVNKCKYKIKKEVNFKIGDYTKTEGAYDGFINCTYPFYNQKESENMLDHSRIVKSISTHFDNYYKSLQYAEANLKRGGSCILFGSIYGLKIPNYQIYEKTNMFTGPDYIASKAGLIKLVEYFAEKNKKIPLRFNCVSPGGIYNHQDEKFVSKYTSKTLYGEMLNSADLDSTIEYLLDKRSRMITGQNIVVDGGYTL